MKTYYFDRFRDGHKCGVKPGRKSFRSGGYTKANSITHAFRKIHRMFKDRSYYFKLRKIV